MNQKKKEGVDRLKKKNDRYNLHLYVTGTTPQSIRAIINLKRLCNHYLKGRYFLKIVDIYQQPDSIHKAQIVAAPTLIKSMPPPFRRLIGDMSDEQRVLTGLGLSS